MCFSIVEGGYSFSDRFRIRPRHLSHRLERLIHEGLFLFFHIGQSDFINTEIKQELTMGWNGVFCFPVSEKVPIYIPWRCARSVSKVQIIMVVGMSASTHGLDVNEGWTASFHCELPSHSSAGMPSGWV